MNRPCLPGIAFLYEGGVRKARIKEMTGHSDAVIYKALLTFDVPYRSGRQREAPFSLEWLRRRYEAGASTTDLAEQYECDQRTIAKYLREAGVKMRPRGRPRKDGVRHQSGWNGFAEVDESSIIADYQAGMKQSDLLQKHAISRCKLIYVLFENRVPPRKPRSTRRQKAGGSRKFRVSEAHSA